MDNAAAAAATDPVGVEPEVGDRRRQHQTEGDREDDLWGFF